VGPVDSYVVPFSILVSQPPECWDYRHKLLPDFKRLSKNLAKQYSMDLFKVL
jgi:hypothetical protein